MMANSRSDADRVYNVNDHQSRMTIKTRENQIKRAGGETLQEDELLDVKMKIQRELNDLTKRG